MAATGKSAEAIKLLNAVMGEARKLGYVSYELESTLVMGEIEINSGKAAAGKTRLEALEKEATAKGFRLVAQKAATLCKRKRGVSNIAILTYEQMWAGYG
jgi:hypothetical protein